MGLLLFLISCSVMSNSLRPCGLYPARLFCLRNFLGKSTQGGCHFLLQGILPTQGLNLSSALTEGFFTTEPPRKASWVGLLPFKKHHRILLPFPQSEETEEFDIYSLEKCLHYNLTVSVHLGLPGHQDCGKYISVVYKLHFLWYSVIEVRID